MRLRTGARITVDPGIGGTGVAVWRAKDWEDEVPPIHTRVLTPAAKLPWEEKVWRLCNMLEDLCEGSGYRVEAATFELAQFFGGAGGYMVAAKGDLVKLCIVTGALAAVTARLCVETGFVEVNAWKGQLSKEVVMRRIEARLGLAACDAFKTHAWDAVGIGLHMKGFEL